MSGAAAVIACIGVVRAQAERIAERVELRGGGHSAKRMGTENGLQDEQAGRDKRQSPSVASSQHDPDLPFRHPARMPRTSDN